MGNTKRGKSGYFGVSWNETAKKWSVQIRYPKANRPTYIGLFSSIEEAAREYDRQAKAVGKTLLNFPEEHA